MLIILPMADLFPSGKLRMRKAGFHSTAGQFCFARPEKVRLAHSLACLRLAEPQMLTILRWCKKTIFKKTPAVQAITSIFIRFYSSLDKY